MHDMGAKRGRPPDSSAAAIRAASSSKPSKPTGRQYTPEFKERILRAVDAARASGDRGAVGALLRREGLNWPTVYRWEQQRTKAPAPRGRPPKHSAADKEIERLRKQNERLQRELKKAEIIIDVQKKLGALLGIEMPEVPDPDKDGTP
jgi:transposase-like protein